MLWGRGIEAQREPEVWLASSLEREATISLQSLSGRGGRAGTLDLSDHLDFPCINVGPSQSLV